MEEFFIGQIFEGEYPPEAAEWCNNRGDCYIDEIESAPAEVEIEEQDENGDIITHTETQIVRRFEIKEIQPETEEEKRMRLNMLSLTKADVLLALYEDKGLTPDDIKAMLKDNVPALTLWAWLWDIRPKKWIIYLQTKNFQLPRKPRQLK